MLTRNSPRWIWVLLEADKYDNKSMSSSRSAFVGAIVTSFGISFIGFSLMVAVSDIAAVVEKWVSTLPFNLHLFHRNVVLPVGPVKKELQCGNEETSKRQNKHNDNDNDNVLIVKQH